MFELRLLTNFTAMAAVIALTACASTNSLPRLNADARNTLETIGVITVGPSLGGDIDGPVGTGRQAAVGTLGGAAAGTVAGLGTGALLGLACGPAALFCVPILILGGGAIGLVSGGTYGGIKGGRNAIPTEKAAEIETSLGQAIASRDLQANLRQAVLQQTGSRAMAIDLGAGVTEQVASPDYSSMAARRIGAVLEIGLTQLTFEGKGGSDPQLSLTMLARARLIRVADNRVLWNVREVQYQSAAAAYSLWSTSDSALLQEQIDKGSEELAGKVAAAIFGEVATAMDVGTGTTGRILLTSH